MRSRNHPGEIEAEHGANQQPRIEFGGFDCSGFKTRRECAPRRLDGLSGKGMRHARKFIRPSSPRTRGPIRRGLSMWEVIVDISDDNEGLWLWVPTFAGTTTRLLRRL